MNLLASFENLCKLCIKCFHFKPLGKRNKSLGRIMGLSGKEIENGLLAFFIVLLGFSAFDSVGFGCASFGYGGSSICKPVACGN